MVVSASATTRVIEHSVVNRCVCKLNASPQRVRVHELKEVELRFPPWSSRTSSFCSGLEQYTSDEQLSCLQDQSMLEQVVLLSSL